jgi:hypothetical protein
MAAADMSVALLGLNRCFRLFQGQRARSARTCPWLPSVRAFGAPLGQVQWRLEYCTALRAFGAPLRCKSMALGILHRASRLRRSAQVQLNGA